MGFEVSDRNEIGPVPARRSSAYVRRYGQARLSTTLSSVAPVTTMSHLTIQS